MSAEKKIKGFVVLLFILGIYGFFTGTKLYDGVGEGFAGEIKVSVEMHNNTLKNIHIIQSGDTPQISGIAYKELTKEIIGTQSLEVDNIAGATYSSKGFKEAVSMAVAASGASLKKKEMKDSDLVLANVKADIVVIGGGGAGLAAAIEATEKGSKVILIEKMPLLGGNTMYATGGINAVGTPQQKNQDSEEIFVKDTIKGGGNKNNPSLVMLMVKKSKDAIKWLTDRGADLSDVGRMGGASYDRTHRPAGGDKVGPNIIEALSKTAENLKIDIRLMTKAVEILSKDGIITGVVVESHGKKYTIESKAVIVATGGFGNNEELFAKFDPKLKGFVSTNHPGATGDAIKMLESYNVELVDIQEIQTHPTVVPSNSAMVSEAVRGNGAVLINKEGNRFIDELNTRDVVSKAILDQKGQTAYLLFDTNVRTSLKAIESYIKMGIATEGKDLKELSEKLNLDLKSLEETIKTYNNSVQIGSDKFGRGSLPTKLDVGPYFAIEVAPGVHHTMGGIKIDEKTRVYSKDGKIISGLYGAGEVTGGVHGGNRLGGNALTDIIVFGRIAGEEAVKYIKE